KAEHTSGCRPPNKLQGFALDPVQPPKGSSVGVRRLREVDQVAGLTFALVPFEARAQPYDRRDRPVVQDVRRVQLVDEFLVVEIPELELIKVGLLKSGTEVAEHYLDLGAGRSVSLMKVQFLGITEAPGAVAEHSAQTFKYV